MKATRTLPALLAAALLAGCSSDRVCVDAHESAAIARTRVERMPASFGAFELASPFSDHMVLQRDCPIPVWGTVSPDETVSVELVAENGKTVAEASATAGANGRWIAFLPSQPAGGPFKLRAERHDKWARQAPVQAYTRIVEDVLVGDVWLCGGQSNMEMSFTWGVKDGEKELADADLPQVRLLHVQRAIDIEPRDAVAGSWT